MSETAREIVAPHLTRNPADGSAVGRVAGEVG